MDNSILVTPEIEILWNRVNSEREISMLNKKRFLLYQDIGIDPDLRNKS
jgi:hypothetical protein